MWYALDDAGEPTPASGEVVNRQMESDHPLRVVALDEPSPGVLLSTVFTFVDQSLGREGGPVVFESMWLDGPLAGERRQYRTRGEALEGHREMLLEYAVRTHPLREEKLAELAKKYPPPQSWYDGPAEELF